MEAADASRSSGASPEVRDVRSSLSPNGSLENGVKAEGKEAKTANGHGGEVAEGKGTGGALKPGEGKSSLFSGSEWRRPIIQFVESVDDKGSSYFSMDSGEGRRSPYAGLQLGAAKKPPVTFAEKGEPRRSIFSEPRKPSVSIVEPGDIRRNSYPRGDSSTLLRSKSGSEEVLCDSCIGNKQKAVKSCLVCQASFCELHLKPHLEGAAFRDHQLLEPIRDFEARKCPLHGKTMELFCQTDQTCICYLCMFQEHKNHSTVTVEEAKAEKEVRAGLLAVRSHLIFSTGRSQGLGLTSLLFLVLSENSSFPSYPQTGSQRWFPNPLRPQESSHLLNEQRGAQQRWGPWPRS